MRWLRLAGHVLAGVLLAPPVAGLRTRGRGGGIVRWWLRHAASIVGLDVRVYGRPVSGPALWCGNHVSWLDVLALGSIGDVVFVSKAEVRRWPIVGRCAAAAGALFLERGSGAPLAERIAERLRAGETVVLFPEGTTSTGAGVGRFHARPFAAALAAGADVQPLALSYSEGGRPSRAAPFVGDDALLPHLRGVLAARALLAEVRFARPLPPEGRDRRGLALSAERATAAALAELRAPSRGAGPPRRADPPVRGVTAAPPSF